MTRRPRRRAAALGLAVWLLAIPGCGAVNVRPRFEPLPDARLDTIRGAPAAIIDTAAALLRREGLTVQRVSPAEGYVETAWYDVAAGRSRRSPGMAPHRFTRLRLWADRVSEFLVQVVGEAVIRPVVDPSLPEREAESMAPGDHPATRLLERVFAGLSERFGRP